MRQFQFSQLHNENEILKPHVAERRSPQKMRKSSRPLPSKLIVGVFAVAVVVLGYFLWPNVFSFAFLKKKISPPPPPVLSVFVDPSVPEALKGQVAAQLAANTPNYQTAASAEQADLQFSVEYSGQLLSAEQGGWYLVPVMHYKHLTDEVTLATIKDYQVVTLDTYAPALEAYLKSKGLANPVTGISTTPTPTPSTPQDTDDSTPTEANSLLSLFRKLNTAYKQKQLIVGFLPPELVDGRFKVLTWEKTHFLNQFTTKKPRTNPNLLSFTLQSMLKAGLSEELNQLAAPLQQLGQTEWPKEFPTFDTTKLTSLRVTGVTAISRQAAAVTDRSGDPAYMAGKIGDFLADADLTHTSNEVSFAKGCVANTNTMRFCAKPDYIKALEKSGMDIIELTGNHNNDFGASNNTYSINMYKERQWDYFGGGLNDTDAAKILYKDVKGTKLAFIGYDYYDTLFGGGALAGPNKAGANSYSDRKLKRNVEEARKNADVVMVHFQFQECWAYTTGNTICYKPITSPPQQQVFRKAVDYGADIVVGTQAHQPQTYEYYNGKMIFYGLGNLFFDQDEWLGTRQGLILTHYFYAGDYLTTEVTTTIYDTDLRPYVTTGSQREQLLKALQ